MKKIILAAILMASGSAAYALDACVAGTATPVTGSATSFVRVTFTPVCSANSVVQYTDDANNQRVYGGSASSKGASYFGGSTLGGAIQRVGDCTNKSCGGTETATRAGAGMTAAQAYGMSS